jgi:hypothetical protein
MRNKAIIIDLDGTAIDSPFQKLPTDRLIASVKNLQTNYHISSATGRVWTFAKPVLQSLKLIDPCVISAGTQICDPLTGKILWQKTIDEKNLAHAIKILKQYPDYKLLYNDATEDDYFNGGKYPQEFTNSEPVYFLEQVFVPDAIAIEICSKLNTINGIVCVMVVAQKPGTRDLHVLNSEATKEHAIAELLKIINIKKEYTIGIGDGQNDIHLFNGVNRKVAMANAVDDLKNVADEVIGNVKDDGLAEYFEKLALE